MEKNQQKSCRYVDLIQKRQYVRPGSSPGLTFPTCSTIKNIMMRGKELPRRRGRRTDMSWCGVCPESNVQSLNSATKTQCRGQRAGGCRSHVSTCAHASPPSVLCTAVQFLSFYYMTFHWTLLFLSLYNMTFHWSMLFLSLYYMTFNWTLVLKLSAVQFLSLYYMTFHWTMLFLSLYYMTFNWTLQLKLSAEERGREGVGRMWAPVLTSVSTCLPSLCPLHCSAV